MSIIRRAATGIIIVRQTPMKIFNQRGFGLLVAFCIMATPHPSIQRNMRDWSCSDLGTIGCPSSSTPRTCQNAVKEASNLSRQEFTSP